MKYRKRPIVIQATQWDIDGSHSIVQPFMSMDVWNDCDCKWDDEIVCKYCEEDGNEICEDCSIRMKDHGWFKDPHMIRNGKNIEDILFSNTSGRIVCPNDWIIEEKNREPYICTPTIKLG